MIYAMGLINGGFLGFSGSNSDNWWWSVGCSGWCDCGEDEMRGLENVKYLTSVFYQCEVSGC